MRFSLILSVCLIVFTAATTAQADNLTNAVQDAARGYRVQVYETFRTQRTEYDQRRAVADGLLSHWDQAGRPAVWSEELIQWFQQATAASVNAESELPPLPDLLPVSEPAAAPEVQTIVPADEPANTRSEAVAPATVPSTTAEPTATTGPTATAEPTVTTEPVVSEEGAESADATTITAEVTEQAAPQDSVAAPEFTPEAESNNTGGALKAIGNAFWRTMVE